MYALFGRPKLVDTEDRDRCLSIHIARCYRSHGLRQVDQNSTVFGLSRPFFCLSQMAEVTVEKPMQLWLMEHSRRIYNDGQTLLSLFSFPLLFTSPIEPESKPRRLGFACNDEQREKIGHKTFSRHNRPGLVRKT